MRFELSGFLVAAAVLALGSIDCSASSDTNASSAGFGGSTSGGGSDAGIDAPQGYTLRIDPEAASAVVSFGVTPAPVAFKAIAKDAAGKETDVTALAAWSADPKLLTIASNGSATLTGIGGKTTIGATWSGADANASLTIKLTGDVFGGGADPSTKTGFAGATSDPTPANAPAIEYPGDGVVLPANLPPIDAQWSQAADNAAYRVHLTLPDVLDATFYTLARDLVFPTDAWATIAATAPDAVMALTIDALGGGKLRTSAPHAVTVASDAIDDSAIYVWESSSGTFRVLDIIKSTNIPFPTDSPALQPGQPCAGCHRISRDGKRFSYTFNGGNFEFGTATYDPMQSLFATKITPAVGVRGTYATFNPLEAETVPAMIVTLPDDVPQNTAGTVRLDVVDPESNMPIQSDIQAMIDMLDLSVGHATSMPDWSPDGSFVVFAAYDSKKNFVRLLGDDIVLASIVEAPVSYSIGKGFVFGAPKVLVQTPDADPDTGQNNLLPTVSPDQTAVAFTRAAGWWSIKTQVSQINLSGQIAVTRRSDGTVFVLKGASNDPGQTWSNTWPQWAPSIGKRWMWLAYGSERPYGHLLTPSSPENAQCGFVQGQKQCKHLWITAIDKQKLAAGPDDPSAAPFYVPAQTLAAQYVSPQWTKAVLPIPK